MDIDVQSESRSTCTYTFPLYKHNNNLSQSNQTLQSRGAINPMARKTPKSKKTFGQRQAPEPSYFIMDLPQNTSGNTGAPPPGLVVAEGETLESVVDRITERFFTGRMPPQVKGIRVNVRGGQPSWWNSRRFPNMGPYGEPITEETWVSLRDHMLKSSDMVLPVSFFVD